LRKRTPRPGEMESAGKPGTRAPWKAVSGVRRTGGSRRGRPSRPGRTRNSPPGWRIQPASVARVLRCYSRRPTSRPRLFILHQVWDSDGETAPSGAAKNRGTRLRRAEEEGSPAPRPECPRFFAVASAPGLQKTGGHACVAQKQKDLPHPARSVPDFLPSLPFRGCKKIGGHACAPLKQKQFPHPARSVPDFFAVVPWYDE